MIKSGYANWLKSRYDAENRNKESEPKGWRRRSVKRRKDSFRLVACNRQTEGRMTQSIAYDRANDCHPIVGLMLPNKSGRLCILKDADQRGLWVELI